MSNLSRYACLVIFFVDIRENDDVNISGHPHSTYAQKGRGGVKSNVSSCVKGEGGSRLRTYVKKFVRTFVQNKLLHCHLLLFIEKCKPVLSYK